MISRMCCHQRWHTGVTRIAFQRSSLSISAYANRSRVSGSRKIEYVTTPCSTSVSASSCQMGVWRRSYSTSCPGCTAMRNALRIMLSHDPCAKPNRRAALVGLLAPISARAIHADGVDRSAGPCARGRQDGPDIGRKRVFQRLQGHDWIVAVLIRPQRVAIDQMSLYIRTSQLDSARHERLDRIGHIVRLIQHVGRVEPRQVRELRVHELVENQEQLKRLDRAGIQIVIPILTVIEMKAAELAELDEPCDDELDVDVRRVVAEVDQRLGLRSQLAHAVITGSPVVEHRRVERGLIEFVFDEQPPAVRHSRVN